ncbi:YceI family protein [Paenibacillus sp. S-38]|uniref:YceI family protein n=1 Tax=Paenibacillus sp. S-38 TaxID=3416710 RepID=UPI003CE6D0DE
MKQKMIALSAGVIVVLIGAYAAYDYFAGNHVTVQEVIPASASAQASGGAVVEAGKLNGQWNIQPESKVYFSVTTSKETVNFESGEVQGQWTLDVADPSKNAASASLEIAKVQSGNATRDSHVAGEKFLNAAAFPKAEFKAKSFEGLPKEWKDGEKVSFTLPGTLTVKGVSKDVTFKTDALYSGGTIKLEGSTVVTFDDFGLKNPHAVVVDTENNITLQLRLVLAQS